MNLLFLSELFYPHGSGAELATYLYAKLLSKEKFNVIVVTNRFDGESEFSKVEGITVYRLPLFKKSGSIKYSILQRVDVLFSGFMNKLLKWADVVYIPRFWFSAIPLAKALGKRVIVHFHDYIPICPLAVFYDLNNDSFCKKTHFCSNACIYAFSKKKQKGTVNTFVSSFLNLSIFPLLKRLIEFSDAIICVSKFQRDLLIKSSPSLIPKTRVIYNPLPSLPLTELSGDSFGYFGGPSYLKGFSVLIKAMSYWKTHRINPITLYATKFSGFNEYSPSSLRDLGFVLYNKLDHESYSKIYQKIRAVIVPSIWYEPFGYVAAEALLRGRLLIASRVGALPELAKDCKGVFFFDANNYIELTKILRNVRDLSKEKVIDLALQNRDTMLKSFDSSTTVLSFSHVLNNL